VIVGVAAIVFVLTQGLRPPTRDPSSRMALSVLAGIVILGVLTLGVGLLVAGPVVGTVVQQPAYRPRQRRRSGRSCDGGRRRPRPGPGGRSARVLRTPGWSTIANDRSRELPLARAGGRV